MHTFQDCEKKAEELGLPANKIAKAHGIRVPMDEDSMQYLRRLQEATTQKERWQVHEESPEDSPIEQAALLAIEKACEDDLRRATTQEELWQVYNDTPDGSAVEQATIRALCS